MCVYARICISKQLHNYLILCMMLPFVVNSKSYLCLLLHTAMSMVLPGVVGFKLSGKLRNGVTSTDFVLTVTQMRRKHGVVGKFVEFYGKPIG